MQLRSDRIPYLYDTQENNRSELQRLDSERKEEFMRMLKGFVASQAAYADKIVDGWETVAEETSGYVGVRGSDSMTS